MEDEDFLDDTEIDTGDNLNQNDTSSIIAPEAQEDDVNVTSITPEAQEDDVSVTSIASAPSFESPLSDSSSEDSVMSPEIVPEEGNTDDETSDKQYENEVPTEIQEYI